MAGNPRKFSEKIALHTQKQMEETAAFEQIMKEVMDVSSRPSGQPQTPKTKQQQNLLNITGPMNCRSLPNVHTMSQHSDKGSQGHGQRSPRQSRNNSIGPVKSPRSSRTDHSPYASPPNNMSMLNSMNAMGNSGSNLSSQGMYQNVTNYLPIPMDPSSWRRANSDSALHSLMIPTVVHDSSEESSNNSNDPRDYGLQSMGHSPTRHQQDPLGIQNTVGDGGTSLLEVIPPSVSTGSLPDLTNFQFTPPLQQPIDSEDPQLNNSPYSTSPLSVTYSPTGGSPHPPPNSNNPQQQQQQGGGQRSSQHPSMHPHQHQQQQQQPQSQQHQQQTLQQQQQQQHQSMMDNPLNVNVNPSFQNFTPNDNMLSADMLNYRCPQRPSPQNSPSPFRSPSPLDGQLSAPGSPSTAPPQNSSESYYLSQQANALQQHFEQISMVDSSRSPQRNSNHWQGGGMINNYSFYNTGQIQTGATAGITTQQSPQHHQPQTPQTPSSIPDIIFTDFSEVRSEPFDDLLASEAAQALREGLGHIDMDGFNMLADPDLVQLDPQAEDTFRLDRL